MVICYTTKENINHYTTDFDNIDRFTEEHPYATIWYAFNEKDDVSSSNVEREKCPICGNAILKGQNNYYKMPNDIFGGKLSAGEIKVLAALYSLRSKSIYRGQKYVKVNQATIARICGFSSARTVSSAIAKLSLYGYIRAIRRYYADYHKLDAYVYTLPVMRKNYFFVDRKIFKHKLTSAQFRMYLFFCKAANPSNKRCWNSFNDIANALGIKRTVVVKTVKELISMKLIRKYRIKKSDGSFSDNHYKVIPLQYTYKFRRKRKRPCRSLLRQGLNICYKLAYASSLTSVKQTVAFVKRKSRKNLFFVTRGSPFFCSTYDSTHFYTNRKKNRIRLYLKYRCNLTLYHLKNPFKCNDSHSKRKK